MSQSRSYATLHEKTPNFLSQTKADDVQKNVSITSNRIISMNPVSINDLGSNVGEEDDNLNQLKIEIVQPPIINIILPEDVLSDIK